MTEPRTEADLPAKFRDALWDLGVEVSLADVLLAMTNTGTHLEAEAAAGPRDPLSPQWEDCKECGGDHWTKDHPEAAAGPRASLHDRIFGPNPEAVMAARAEAAAGPRDVDEAGLPITHDPHPREWYEGYAAAVAAGPRDIDRLRDMFRGISLPPGPDFAWVDGHKPFIAAALAIIDQWAAAGPRDEGLLRAASDILDSLDGQADNPGPDHLIKVSVETWRDAIRPTVQRIRAALAKVSGV